MADEREGAGELSWIPLAWLLVAPVGVWVAVTGIRGDRSERASVRARLLRVLPSLGMFAAASLFAVIAVFDTTPDPEYSVWLVAFGALVASIVTGLWYRISPWWEE